MFDFVSSERVAIHRSQDSLPPFWTGIGADRRSVIGIRLYGFSVSAGLSQGAVGLFDLHKKVLFKELCGSFAILFWSPCATWHSVVTHTHHTHFDRGTLFFATLRQGRSEVSWGFLFYASGLSLGFQPRCTASSCGRHATRTNTIYVDFRSVQLSNDSRN